MQHLQPKRARSSSPSTTSNKRTRAADSNSTVQSQSESKGPPLSLSFSRLPAVMLTSISDYLVMHSAACMASCSTGMKAAVYQTDAFKGSKLWRAHPHPIDVHPKLDVWKSEAGLRLLGRREVTMQDLSLIYPAEPVHAPAAAAATANAPVSTTVRIALLRYLTERTSGGQQVLALFASKALTLAQFDACTTNELQDLLHPDVETVVRSGWLPQDTLFKLHEGRAIVWKHPSAKNRTEQSLLQAIIHPIIRGLGNRVGRVLIRLADTFLPLTDTCIAVIASLPYLVGLLVEALERASAIKTTDANKRYTLRALRTHWDASLQCSSLYSHFQDGAFCTCICTCGSVYFIFCKCCTGGCKRRQVERFEKALADLSPSFLGPPPSAVSIMRESGGGIKRDQNQLPV